MLKENIDFSKLHANAVPAFSGFNINFNEILTECTSLAEIISMLRLFKTLAIHREDFIAANAFRDAERELRRQAAAFEASWAWMNAQQMQDEIKKQVAALIPTLSFRPDLGVVEAKPELTAYSSNDRSPRT